MLLAVDILNPVKRVCSVLGLHCSVFGIPAFLLLLHLLLLHYKRISYYSIRTFFTSILSIFFQSVDVIGLEQVPVGPRYLFH